MFDFSAELDLWSRIHEKNTAPQWIVGYWGAEIDNHTTRVFHTHSFILQSSFFHVFPNDGMISEIEM